MNAIDSPEAALSQAMAEWEAAFCARDVDRLLACYTSDAVCFDAIPPFTDNLTSLRQKYLECFPCIPEGCRCEVRDLRILRRGTLAVTHFLWRLRGDLGDSPVARTWLRGSQSWVLEGEDWRICHEHWSLPFDIDSGQVCYQVEE